MGGGGLRSLLCSAVCFFIQTQSVTITVSGYVNQLQIRMLWLFKCISLIFLVFTQENHGLGNDRFREPNPEQIRSPMLEVFMHLPPNLRDPKSFLKTNQDKNTNQRERIVDVRNYEIYQPVLSQNKSLRLKREATEPEKLVSQPTLPKPDAIRAPDYSSYPVREFDIVDIDDPEDPRRRRNDSSNGPDDNSQRDKRTFLEEGSGETTTPLPFWKRKKENPPFVTGRGGSVQNGNSYIPAQHRSAENARESHSLKSLDKSVQSNEISRSNQDNYYSATNRRTYSRQYDSVPSSTPKSVYDTIDYNQKRNQEPGRAEFGRNQESGRNVENKKETLRDTRPTHEQYTSRQLPYNFPWPYDRPYYQPPFSYPTEVLGRGVEYYHRTYDPTTGRIVYYANMPEQGRSYDYRYLDPINRNFYVNRPYYDPYYRNYVPPFDYRYVNGFDYLRSGRSSSQAYSYPFQEREKFPRDARFSGAFETGNRFKDDFKNRTYIIYDAEDRRSQFSRPQFVPDNSRPSYTPPSNNSPPGPFRQFPPSSIDNFSPAVFPFGNQYHPSSTVPWGFGQRSPPGVTDTGSNSRPPNSPEIQLPLTTSHRRELEKSKKS